MSKEALRRIHQAILHLKNEAFKERFCIVEKTPFDDDDESSKTITEGEVQYVEIIVRLLPKSSPYNESGFRMRLRIPVDYPLRPPKAQLVTKIYHINVGPEGLIQLI